VIGAIDVRDLVGRFGSWRIERVSGTIEDLATTLAGLREDTPVTGELMLESLEEGILASGRVQGVLSLRCARCLREFEEGFSVELRELFATFPHEDSDEYPLDPEGFLDPHQMMRDAIGVELPFAPVCRPDCRGLCSRCGGDLNLGECTCTEPEIDPRWNGLAALLEDLDLPAGDQHPEQQPGHRPDDAPERRPHEMARRESEERGR
jgi:uncharacterized protein